MLQYGLCQTIANLLEIQVAESTSNFLRVQWLTQIPRHVSFLFINKRAPRSILIIPFSPFLLFFGILWCHFLFKSLDMEQFIFFGFVFNLLLLSLPYCIYIYVVVFLSWFLLRSLLFRWPLNTTIVAPLALLRCRNLSINSAWSCLLCLLLVTFYLSCFAWCAGCILSHLHIHVTHFTDID